MVGATSSARCASYRKAVAQVQSEVQADERLQRTPDADGLTLRPGMASIWMAQPAPTGKGTVVMLHGYTAGPWQYKEMAQRFYQAGYNVYVPRLPGHGMQTADGTPSGAEVPKSYQGARYDQFVDGIYREVSAVGGPVYAVGLSGGADLAMDLAARHPQVKGIVAMSPYVGGNEPKGLIFDVFNALDAISFGLFGRLLDHLSAGKNTRVPNDATPHTQSSFGAAMALERLGRSIKTVPCPVEFLTTDGDFLAGSWRVGRVFKRSDASASDGWYRFPKSQKVPHAMLSPLENKAPGAAQKVSDITFDFIDRGLASQQH